MSIFSVFSLQEIKSLNLGLNYALRILGRPDEVARLEWHYYRQTDGRYMNERGQYMPIPMDGCLVRTPSEIALGGYHTGVGNSIGQLQCDPLGADSEPFGIIDRVTPVYFNRR